MYSEGTTAEVTLEVTGAVLSGVTSISNQEESSSTQDDEAAKQEQAVSPFQIRLEEFDGPIDLLLHLVKREELPIEKVSLARVADQYFNAISHYSNFDLELAGEYLVIAATLLSIKAALILDPKADKTIEIDEGPDPHEELLQRLRDAEIYQEAARVMGGKHQLGIDVFEASAAFEESSESVEVMLARHEASALVKAFRKLLGNLREKPVYTVNWRRVSIADCMQRVVGLLESKGTVSFSEVLEEDYDLPVLVTSFIALLELCRRQVIRITQVGYNDSIALSLITETQVDDTMFVSEFDEQDQVSERSVSNV